MSAQWQKANGMRQDSTAAELRRRSKFAPELGEPSAEEIVRARVVAAKTAVEVTARRVRNALRPASDFDPNDFRSDGVWTPQTGGLRLEDLPKECKTLIVPPEPGKQPVAILTRTEDKFAGRWTPGYVAQLAGAFVQHIKLQSARFTQWMLK